VELIEMAKEQLEEISLRSILVPIDGSEPSFRAANYAIKIAQMAGAQVQCIHTVARMPTYSAYTIPTILTEYIEGAKQDAQKWYDEINAVAAKAGVEMKTETILDVTSVADSIINYAKQHSVDLIVIGTKGRTGLTKFVLGSVASGVTAHALCPVLVVR
jgi:nucleotide-binding universal stress UspA family protein